MRIVVGGQIDKDEIAAMVRSAMPEATVAVKGDLDAVMAMKKGEFDYYVGACNTGGGGALAMALALLFGFTAQHKDQVLPVLLSILKRKEGGTL